MGNRHCKKDCDCEQKADDLIVPDNKAIVSQMVHQATVINLPVVQPQGQFAAGLKGMGSVNKFRDVAPDWNHNYGLDDFSMPEETLGAMVSCVRAELAQDMHLGTQLLRMKLNTQVLLQEQQRIIDGIAGDLGVPSRARGASSTPMDEKKERDPTMISMHAPAEICMGSTGTLRPCHVIMTTSECDKGGFISKCADPCCKDGGCSCTCGLKSKPWRDDSWKKTAMGNQPVVAKDATTASHRSFHGANKGCGFPAFTY